MIKTFFSCLLVLVLSSARSQDAQPVDAFNSTRVISGHSADMLWKKEMDIRITHRFGDAGVSGAGRTMFGLDNAADIRIAVEYGVSNNFMIGLGRCKGAGPQTQLLDGFLKYNFMKQTTDNKKPLTITLLTSSFVTMMERSTDSTSATHFGDNSIANRMSYCTQLLLSRKFGSRLSLQLMPTYVHRNFVAFDDSNGLFSVGAAFRFRFTKVFALLGEYYQNMGGDRVISGVQYRNAMGVGLEFDTGGHLFMINFTNSSAIHEAQFIPYTSSDISKGQFRLGFTISRIIKF